MNERKPYVWPMRGAGIAAVVFGALTLRTGGGVLFGDGAQGAGNFVGFVLWFNFLAGFAYVAAGIGLWLQRAWSAWLALALAAGTLVFFAAFGIHIAAGGSFESRTAVAMTLRSAFWIAMTWLAFRSLGGTRSARKVS